MLQLPNLIIPGAPKAGTSSLVEYLGQHSDIFVPRYKEPRFFISDEIRNLPANDPLKSYLQEMSILDKDKYFCIYKSHQYYKVRIDASVQYLYYHKQVIPRIRRMIDQPYIVICLRNPVDRAYSNYQYMKLTDSFQIEIEKELEKLHNGWNSFTLFFAQGLYYNQVKSYMQGFSKVKIVLFEDLANQTSCILEEVLNFLDLDPTVLIDTDNVYNESGAPKNRFLEKMVFQKNLVKRVFRPIATALLGKSGRERLTLSIRSRSVSKKNAHRLQDDIRGHLISCYRKDILQLQDLIKRDLSMWLHL
ncbi:MAG: sulfotransferase domain-containing protein [Candidatus Electrothrix sp. GW3-4]|uniref:sulfotransferase domain-containing protein n=1 Tax=Candidatus Electrothrix sp. GW3-4 TaxID=3126740 RepID=UPI0030D376E1